MFKDIPDNIKTILAAILPMFVVLILSFFVGRFGIEKVIEIRGQMDESRIRQETLNQKLGLLRSVGTSLTQNAFSTAIALPSSNPSLAVFAQIKNLGLQNGVLISGIKSGVEVADASGFSRVDISFDAIGERSSIIAFVNSVSSVAPLSIVDKIKLSESGESTRANIIVKAFWAPLPTTLPEITEPISDLTAEERDTLLGVGGLIPPPFSEVTESQAAGRSDPFNP